MRSAAILATVVFALAAASPAVAGGALYTVPEIPPSETDSVGFTNSLNKGVPGVPVVLSNTPDLTPQRVEARARILERGVVIRPRSASEDRRTEILAPVGAPSFPGREPLLAAFIAAGALALAGLALAAKRRQHGAGLRSAE